MRKILGIIFDVDGVLINTEDIHYAAYQKALNSYDISLNYEDYLKWFSGRSIEGGVEAFNKNNDLKLKFEEIKLKKIDATINAFRNDLKFYAETLEFIKKVSTEKLILKELGIEINKPKLAIATGLNKVLAEAMLEGNPLLKNSFSVVITAEDYSKSKPDPEPYLKAVEKLGLKPEDCIGIEDSPPGIKSLNNAGIFSIALVTTHSKEQIKDAQLILPTLLNLF